MPIKKLIENSAFAPEALDVVYAAFDAAWEEVSSRIGPDPTAIEFARNRLAQAIFRAAEMDLSDPIRIRTEAVEAFLSSAHAKD